METEIELDHIFLTSINELGSDDQVRDKLEEISNTFDAPERFSNKLKQVDEDTRSDNYLIFTNEEQSSRVQFQLYENPGELLTYLDFNQIPFDEFHETLGQALELFEALEIEDFHAFYIIEENFNELSLPISDDSNWEDREITGLRFVVDENEYILQSQDEVTTAKFMINEPSNIATDVLPDIEEIFEHSTEVLTDLG